MDKSLQTDKHFWHGYTQMYDDIFEITHDPRNILEYGVFHGASIRFLAERFPNSQILGLDILEPQSDWPTSSKISYLEIDQGDFSGLQKTLAQQNRFYDLVIEDGSHHPVHQINSLLATLPFMKPGSVYVVEDIHTSKYELATKLHFDRPLKKRFNAEPQEFLNLYNFLLGVEHSLRIGRDPMSQFADRDWNSNRLTLTQAQYISSRVSQLTFFNRNTYPTRCFNCGSENFNYALDLCSCGVSILSNYDSISSYIVLK